MGVVKGVTQRIMSVTQLKILKDFESNSECTLWLREKGFRTFGRITINNVRHQVWFNPKMIDKRRVRAHFKLEMKNENS